MNKSFLAATAGLLAGATLLFCAAPAIAHEHVDFALSLGVPVYAAPPVAYYAPPPVVYGGYGPVAQVGAPYYYGRGWRDDHHGWRHDHDWREHRDGHFDRGYHEGHREWHR